MSSDESNSNIKDVIDATTGLVKAVPIYEDLLQPAAKQVGIALGTIAKSVNVALAPVSIMIWGYDSIKEFVDTSVSQKLQNVSAENIEKPNPVVVGPALEALKYCGHEETLRDMYANLLANALDKDTKKNAHPSFVELIKQLSPSEAKLLLHISDCQTYPEICKYANYQSLDGDWSSFGGEGIISNKVKNEFINLCEDFKDDLDISSALDNFRRLQIVEVESHTNHSLSSGFDGYSMDDVRLKVELRIEHIETLTFTEYGSKFINICVKEKT